MRRGYTEPVGGKLRPMDKKILTDSKYNVRHAIEYFNTKITDPKKFLEVEKYFLEEELRELKLDSIVIERKIDEINQELCIQEYSVELNNFLDYVRDDYTQVAREYGQKQYDIRGNLARYPIEDYIDSNLDFFVSKANDIQMDVKELCKEVIAFVKS